MELFHKSKDLKARTSPKPFLDYRFLRLLHRIIRFMSLRDLRLKLVLSPIIVNICYKRVLNHKYILNNNFYINNTSLPLKIWLRLP